MKSNPEVVQITDRYLLQPHDNRSVVVVVVVVMVAAVIILESI